MDLVKFRQSLTSPVVGPALPPLDLEKEPNGEDLLRLVDEVTRDEEPPSGAFRGGVRRQSDRGVLAGSYNGSGSGSYSAGSSLAQSSHIFAPPAHPAAYSARVIGSSPPPFHGSISDRPKGHETHADSSALSNGHGPQFPRLDDRLMQGFSPPPHSAPPPSFESTIAQMREGHGTSPMLHGAPAPAGGAARVPETLIVRNDHGVFLLQPTHLAGGAAHGVSPVVRTLAGGSPPSYGAPNVPPPPYAESPALGHMLPPPYAMTQSPVPSAVRDDLPPPPPYELTPSPSLRPVGD